ncbi:hypothetical protein Tco_1499681 [Tanacetum coccineum]
MMVQASQETGEGSGQPTDPHNTPIITQPSSSTQPQRKQQPRKPKKKNTEVPQPSGSTDNVADEAVNEEMYDSLERATTTTTGLDAEQDRGNISKTQSKATLNELSSIGTSSGSGPRSQDTMGVLLLKLDKKGVSRTHKLKRLRKVGSVRMIVSSEDEGLGNQVDASKQGRKIGDIDADEGFTLIDETKGRYGDDLGLDTGVLDVTTAGVKVSAASTTPVSAATTTTTTGIIEVEITLAQSLAELKNAKPKVVAKDKGKAKMIEPEKPLKKKEQMRIDEELALKLQAEEEEEARLFKEKAQQVEEANISWDNVSKREGEDLQQESTKKQKVDDDDKEKEDLKQCFKIVPEEEITINVIPLATKPAPIVNFQIHKKERQGYYEIMRAYGSSKTYLLFSQLLKEFDRDDLENLWKLVKAKHGYTMLEEAYEKVLWG